MRIIELFGGIGACTQALKKLGIDVDIVDYVEIDKYAVASYNAINDTNFTTQDITQWNKHYDNIDLIMHGSPCQDFSLAGKQAGGDEGSGTRSSLMYETIRIVKDIKPKYVIWENVKNLLSQKHKHNFDAYIDTMEQLGYTNYYQVLNAKDYGIPQNRERVFTISIRNDINKTFEFPKKQELKLKLKDMLEDDVDEKYYVKKSLNIRGTKNYIQWSNSGKLQNSQAERAYYIQNEVMCTIPNCNTGGDKSQIVLDALCNDSIGVVVNNKRLKETIDGNVKQIKENSYIDSYNKKINNTGITGTITARVSASNETHIAVKNEPKVLGGIGEKKSNNGTQWYQQDRIYDNNVGISVTTCCNPYYPDNSLRIRKLTPKECWRLMGFSDECFEKASKVNSNAQLYKQAGNSIVVNVLEAIFRNLIK